MPQTMRPPVVAPQAEPVAGVCCQKMPQGDENDFIAAFVAVYCLCGVLGLFGVCCLCNTKQGWRGALTGLGLGMATFFAIATLR